MFKKSSLKSSYKSDFSSIYNKVLEAAKTIESNNLSTIDVLLQEPDGSNLATGSGTSNITFLFEQGVGIWEIVEKEAVG